MAAGVTDLSYNLKFTGATSSATTTPT